MSDASLDEICVVACAEAWRGDGEILASAAGGLIPTLGALLARATFEPDLLINDGESYLLALPTVAGERRIEGYLPFRAVFDTVWAGRRHVMMGASQIDRHGNQNISCIGPWQRPKAQLIGVRGAPGNTVNHATSYWVPNHTPRVFVEHVDMVSGVGYDRAGSARYLDLRRVITNLGVMDFETPDRTMRLRSLHPGIELAQIVQQTGFALQVPEPVATTRLPTDAELHLIREVLDAAGLRTKELPAARP